MDSICILSFRTNLPAIRYFSVRLTGSLPIINGILNDFPLLSARLRRFSSRDYRHSKPTSLFSLTGSRKRECVHTRASDFSPSLLSLSTAKPRGSAVSSGTSVFHLTVSPAGIFRYPFLLFVSKSQSEIAECNYTKGIAYPIV